MTKHQRSLLGAFVVLMGTFMACSDSDDPSASLPEAAFSIGESEILVGRSVEFTDNSSNATSWSWTFEGGTPGTSTEQNPIVTYSSTGSFAVGLAVVNADGTDSLGFENFITVCQNTFQVTTEDGPTDGFYDYDEDDNITLIDLDTETAELTYDTEGRLTQYTVLEEDGNVDRTQSFTYNADSQVTEVNVDRANEEARRYEYTYSTNDDGLEVINETEFRETSEGSGQFEASGNTSSYVMENGNLISLSITEESNGESFTMTGEVTYTDEEWRIDHAIFFDVEMYPIIFNTNLFASVTLTNPESGDAVFTGEMSAVGSGRNIESITYTSSDSDNSSESTTVTFGRNCE